jgi:hypothetical protein
MLYVEMPDNLLTNLLQKLSQRFAKLLSCSLKRLLNSKSNRQSSEVLPVTKNSKHNIFQLFGGKLFNSLQSLTLQQFTPSITNFQHFHFLSNLHSKWLTNHSTGQLTLPVNSNVEAVEKPVFHQNRVEKNGASIGMRHLFFIFRIDRRRRLSVRIAFMPDGGRKRGFFALSAYCP